MSTIKSSSEDLTLNADGSNEVKFQINAVEKASISSAGAFTSTTIDATKLTGEKRNYIIDGDMTQFPEGTVTGAVASYIGALWDGYRQGAATDWDGSQETTILPTVGQSGHNSAQCLKIDIQTADASIAAADLAYIEYNVTGTDYQHLHGQQVTLNFWIRSTATGTFYASFSNSARNRSLVSAFTIDSTDTWEEKTVTVTLDTSGTWLFTEADVGLRVCITPLTVGSNHYASSADAWEAGHFRGLSGMGNLASSASNNIYISQVGLYLGSVAPTFSSESIATVKDQVDYYVQRYEYANEGNEMICSGFQNSTTVSHCQLNYRNYLRTAAPTITHAAAAGFAVSISGGISSATSFTDNNKGRHGCRFSVTHGVQGAAKDPCNWCRDSTDTCWILIDSRH